MNIGKRSSASAVGLNTSSMGAAVAGSYPQTNTSSASNPYLQASPATQSTAGRSFSPASGHKERNLLFGQLSNLFQAGFSAANAFEELARRDSGSRKNMFLDIARMCSEGRSVGEATAKYPGYFPPGISDALGAGEAGGYLPEACTWVSHQQAKTHGLNMFARFFHINMFLTALAFPFAILIAIGSQELLHYINDFQGNPVSRMLGGISRAAMGWPGLMALALAVGWIAVAMWVAAPRQKPLRDRIFSQIPGVGKRTSVECFDVLTKHLSRLSNAGLAPRDAWAKAAACAPNHAIRSKLVRVQLNEEAKLSDLMAQTQVIDRALVDYVATGEMAGNIPGTLDQIANLNQDEIGSKEASIKKHIVAWLVVLSIFVGMIPVAIFFKIFYMSMFDIILDDVMFILPTLIISLLSGDRA